MWTLRWLMALALIVAPARGADAQNREQDREQDRAPNRGPTVGAAERQARGETAAKQFVQGKYDEALAAYLDLYVQSGGRPEYLRNIGRCQQKLKQYDRAIESLKDYLRRARKISAAERTEVQGFISEMEAARSNEAKAPPSASSSSPAQAVVPPAVQVPPARSQPPSSPPSPAAPIQAAPSTPAVGVPAATPPSSSIAPPPPGPVSPAPSTTVPLATASQPETAPVLITQTPAPVAESPKWGGLKIGGVVALIGAGVLAVGGTAMLLAARSTYNEAKTAGCPTTGGTMCEQKANSVSSSNQISQALYIAAGVAGAAGVTMLILVPRPGTSESQISLGARFKF